MLYALPRQAFTEGLADCFIPQMNLSISEVDRETLAVVYPRATDGEASGLQGQDIDPTVLDSLQYLDEQTGKEN